MDLHPFTNEKFLTYVNTTWSTVLNHLNGLQKLVLLKPPTLGYNSLYIKCNFKFKLFYSNIPMVQKV